MNDDHDAIEKFSRKYVVEKRLVEQYADHLLELERKRNKRTESRKRANLEENRKSFADYNWEAMYRLRRNAKETESKGLRPVCHGKEAKAFQRSTEAR